jgi:inositol transport system ATP-binding protein
VNESLNQAAPQAPVPEDLLFAHGITMGFPGVLALDDVQFRLKRGTVHALMGENGAGKSTLMKILAGIYTPDAGEIRLRGVPVTLGSPLDALQRGIAMIHQELNLMAPMTVAENVWIRREPRNRLGLVDHRAMRRMTQTLLEELNIRLDPDAKVAELSVANRQMVEIAKAVSYKSDVLIMDEPTSALTQKEADHLFAIIRDLRAQGVGIV